jgi:hypothetical protein
VLQLQGDATYQIKINFFAKELIYDRKPAFSHGWEHRPMNWEYFTIGAREGYGLSYSVF